MPKKQKKNGSVLKRDYLRACRLARDGDYGHARRIYEQLGKSKLETRMRALIANDLAVLAAIESDAEAARRGFHAALEIDPDCQRARLNLTVLDRDEKESEPVQEQVALGRIAILSFLFNWPSTGGGIVHTVELAQFLGKAGFEVQHFHAQNPAWEIGRVEQPTPFTSNAIEFDDACWSVPEIQQRFRQAVEQFRPDHIIITDSWNMKPILAEAVRGYPYILRLQASECLCPLNNVRLLPEDGGRFRQCPLHQLASPQECARCVRERGKYSGSLHQAERTLSGVGTPEYDACLRRAFAEAEAVLVVNPLTEAMVSPYSKKVHVVTAGMDPARFPWPWPREKKNDRLRILFAGIIDEFMKGFRVLHEACASLWKKRRDFELVATGEPNGQCDEFVRFIGWQSQEELPRHLHEADMLVMPTIAQEALGRTAVEAMAAGRPVVASRIGGLPFTVVDGATGLLCEPGDAKDLAKKIEMLLDDADLRERLGNAGRRRFEEHYSWDVIIDRHYKPLLNRFHQRKEETGTAESINDETKLSRTVNGARNDRLEDAPRLVSMTKGSYRPFLPEWVDSELLMEEVSDFFKVPRGELISNLRTYRELHNARGYSDVLGERKTLCFEEAFILAVAFGLYRPECIVEIGTQHGKSTRRIIDIVQFLHLNARLVCFDVADDVGFFEPHEAELIKEDVSGRFREAVLDSYLPDVLFLDVHTYGLLQEAITTTMRELPQCFIAIHDCTRGLCNPKMSLSKNDSNVTSLTGVWERHVLAEIFGVRDPRSKDLDQALNDTHRLRIFSTPHGLGVIRAIAL